MTIFRVERGFTLIELLAATVLLALALGVLLPAFELSARLIKRDEIHSRMATVSRSLIDEAIVAGVAPGKTNGLRDGLEWQLECVETGRKASFALFTLYLTLHEGDQSEDFSTAHIQSVEEAEPF